MTIPFRPIARLLSCTLHPAPHVDISAVEPLFRALEEGGVCPGMLVTINHYSAPDFKSWWTAILPSASMPREIHWVMTAGWTNSSWLTGFTHWLFPRGARLFGFTSMPAMPPDPAEVEQRAAAVRHILRYAKETPHPLVGLAPEGGDTPGGVLGPLPPGVGRFIYLLTRYCPQILPAGIWTKNNRIHLKFGPPYRLDIPVGLSAIEREGLVGKTIMLHTAELLPDHLRGEYT
jgi:hypothetical protein